jgi:hypothetical protein
MSQDREPAALEERVAELAANVDGLTSELVDAKERIRELEAELGMRETAESVDGEMTVEELFEESDADPIADEDQATENGESESETLGDDIIVG